MLVEIALVRNYISGNLVFLITFLSSTFVTQLSYCHLCIFHLTANQCTLLCTSAFLVSIFLLLSQISYSVSYSTAFVLNE